MKRLAWSLVGLYVVASAVGAVLLARVPAELLERQNTSVSLSLAFMPVVLVFAVIGAVVASRLPGNPIGWLFLALAQIQAVYALAFGYAQYAAGVDPGLSGDRVGGVGRDLDHPTDADRGRARGAVVPGRQARLAALAVRRLGVRAHDRGRAR